MTYPVNQIQGQTKIVVKIDQVDISNRIAHCFDKMHTPVQVSWRQAAGGVMQIPTQGQNWTAVRLGYTWYLDQKLDSMDDHAAVMATMDSGDTRVSADGTVHVLGDGMLVQGQPGGASVSDSFFSDTGWQTVTLTSDPVSKDSIQMLLNGVLVGSTLFTLDGRTITFYQTMAMGHLAVHYQTMAYTYSDIGTVVGRGVPTGVDLFT